MNSEYSSACDAYVFGLIVYEIITGIKPFTSLSMYEILGKITQRIPQNLKNQLIKLTKSSLNNVGSKSIR